MSKIFIFNQDIWNSFKIEDKLKTNLIKKLLNNVVLSKEISVKKKILLAPVQLQ